ncbi:MAG: UDP-2,3-diacylglucosamine diphosphatase LpxI [Sebaldella sp.]|nr:UDP-2,3-diacylglucosamine diphosphatase LpxI [Sebaldella sp.]
MNKIAVIAGAGKLPTLFLNEAVNKGFEVFPIYLFEEADIEVRTYKNSVKFSIAQVGKIVKYLKTNEIKKLIMLGKVEKKLIFSNLKFDLAATKILMSTKNKKDKNILMAIIKYLEQEGIEVMPQNYLLDKYMTKDFDYTKKVPNLNDMGTIEIGLEAAKMLTTIDAGQTVIVKNESVIALEGIEGTDKTIERAGEYAGKDCIIVKMARPNQDYRVDIPTIGIETVKKVVEIKAKGIVVEAEHMLFIDQEQVIKYADSNKIFIKGMKYE